MPFDGFSGPGLRMQIGTGALILAALSYVPAMSPGIIPGSTGSFVTPQSAAQTSEPLPANSADIPTTTAIAAMPVRDRIRKLVSELGVRKAHLARLMGVSRQSIYDWLDLHTGAAAASLEATNQKRLNWIESLAARLGPAESQFGVALNMHLPVQDRTLLELIEESEIGAPAPADALDSLRLSLAKKVQAESNQVELPVTAPQIKRALDELSSPVMLR